MVTVFTWLPAPPSVLLAEGRMPDLGHSSLLVHDDSGTEPDLYCSFWPQMDSVLRRIISLWKNRRTRYPASYAEEIKEQAGFMQRPADFTVFLGGLRESRIRRGWAQLKGTDFDVATWNCASVSQCLLIAAMERERYEGVQDAVDCTLADLDSAEMDSDDMGGVLRYLATSKRIGCCPEDVHRMAVAYEKVFCAADPKFSVQAGAQPVQGEP